MERAHLVRGGIVGFVDIFVVVFDFLQVFADLRLIGIPGDRHMKWMRKARLSGVDSLLVGDGYSPLERLFSD